MNENPKSFEEILEEKGFLVYTTIGNSMRPLLRQNRDIVIIEASQGCRYKKYDVVLYKRNNKYILRRILKVLSDGYIIAGDHNSVLERDITDEKILGTLVQIIRDGKGFI